MNPTLQIFHNEEERMRNIQEAWEAILQILKSDPTVSPAAYDLWIKEIQPIAIEGEALVLSVPSVFQRDIIEQQFAGPLVSAVQAAIGIPLKLLIRAEDEEAAREEEDKQDKQLRRDLTTYYKMINPFYTFKTFVVGPTNDFAYLAAQSVADKPANAYNPLFIWGGSGLGKTHLLHAICNEIHQNNPKSKILYTTCESFTNDFLAALHDMTLPDFRQKYRDVDILLIDDIQFLANKVQTQEEFFNTFEAIKLAGGQVVLTSDRRPNEIATLTDRLMSRFEAGMLADIQPPPIETRILIVQSKAAQLNFHIDKNVCDYIARELKTNVRQIEGVINKLHAEYRLNGSVPTERSAELAISNVRNDNQPVEVTVDRIIAEVARTMNVQPEDIRNKGGNSQISKARKVSAYIIREITRMKTKEIGNEFGGLDHSTISYATTSVENKMKSDTAFKAMVEDILNNLKTDR